MADHRWTIVWAVVVALAVVGVTTLAHAEPELIPDDSRRQSANQVWFVTDDDDGELAKRLHAELATAGFTLVTRPANPAASRSWTGSENTFALLISTAAEGIEVWTRHPKTGKPTLREVVSSDSGDSGEPQTLVAMRTVEVLRATMIELEKAKKTPSPVVVPSPKPVSAPSRSRPRPPPPRRPPTAEIPAETPLVWLGASGAVGWGAGADATAHAGVHCQARWHRWFATELAIVAPLTMIQLEAPEGSAAVAVTSALLDIDVPLLATESPFDLRAGAGVGLSWIHVDAEARAPFTAADDSLFTSWPHVHAALAWAPIDGFRIAFATRVGALTPRPVVRFANRDILQLGSPYLQVALGAELAVF